MMIIYLFIYSESVFMWKSNDQWNMMIINIFIQVDNSINKTNLFRGGNHSSVVFAGSRDMIWGVIVFA